jgi:hypothetical protein
MARKPRVKWYGKQVERVATEAAMKALVTGGEAILTDAIKEAPVDTGTLRRSGTVTKGGLPDAKQVYEEAQAGNEQKQAQNKGKEQAVYVSFNTPYARRQHEELEWEHLKGGKAKYLEDPFNRLKSKVRKLVDASVKKALQQKR